MEKWTIAFLSVQPLGYAVGPKIVKENLFFIASLELTILFRFREYVCISESVTLNDTARVSSLCLWVCNLSAPQSLVSSVIDPLGLLCIFVGILLGGLEYEYRLTPMPIWKSMEGR